MKYELNQKVFIIPTKHMAGDTGYAELKAVMTTDMAEEIMDVGAYLVGDAAHDYEIQTRPWYVFRYTNEALDDIWGSVFIPEVMLDSYSL